MGANENTTNTNEEKGSIILYFYTEENGKGVIKIFKPTHGDNKCDTIPYSKEAERDCFNNMRKIVSIVDVVTGDGPAIEVLYEDGGPEYFAKKYKILLEDLQRRQKTALKIRDLGESSNSFTPKRQYSPLVKGIITVGVVGIFAVGVLIARSGKFTLIVNSPDKDNETPVPTVFETSGIMPTQSSNITATLGAIASLAPSATASAEVEAQDITDTELDTEAAAIFKEARITDANMTKEVAYLIAAHLNGKNPVVSKEMIVEEGTTISSIQRWNKKHPNQYVSLTSHMKNKKYDSLNNIAQNFEAEVKTCAISKSEADALVLLGLMADLQDNSAIHDAPVWSQYIVRRIINQAGANYEQPWYNVPGPNGEPMYYLYYEKDEDSLISNTDGTYSKDGKGKNGSIDRKLEGKGYVKKGIGATNEDLFNKAYTTAQGCLNSPTAKIDTKATSKILKLEDMRAKILSSVLSADVNMDNISKTYRM